MNTHTVLGKAYLVYTINMCTLVWSCNMYMYMLDTDMMPDTLSVCTHPNMMLTVMIRLYGIAQGRVLPQATSTDGVISVQGQPHKMYWMELIVLLHYSYNVTYTSMRCAASNYKLG